MLKYLKIGKIKAIFGLGMAFPWQADDSPTLCAGLVAL